MSLATLQTVTQDAPHETVPDLLNPARLGALELPNRVVMAPLTRNRAGAHGVPQDINTAYYAQRASAGLIITEGSPVSPQGVGYPGTPGIFTDDQAAGWRRVTDAVHGKGGHIFLQLWHVGRISHPSLQPGGAVPVAPSAIRPAGDAFTEAGLVPYVEPRALDAGELPGIIAQHAEAAANAERDGFDGVEIHAANGYLLDQFLRDRTNKRRDAYGGPVENRARLLLEVTAAVTKVFPADRVGVRLSPINTFNDIADSDPEATFGYVAQALNRFPLAYLHVVETDFAGSTANLSFHEGKIRAAFDGAIIANGGYTRDRAVDAIAAGAADFVSFGAPYVANPDLVERFAADAPLNTPDPETFYGGDAHGYTDYPTLADLSQGVSH